MIEFNAILKKFEKQGEKTGWTYLEVPARLAEKLKPGNRKSFRVKGRLDHYQIGGVALIPMGGGDFIMAVNATMRKGLGKRHGAMVRVRLESDDQPFRLNPEFVACLQDEPPALKHFQSLAKGHQRYFSNWIDSAKTEPTRVKRITMAINALARGWGFPEMLRAQKNKGGEPGF